MAMSWEIQPGKGADILASIGEDVRLHASLGVPTAQLEAKEASEAIVDYGFEKTAAEVGVVTARSLLNRLMRAQQLQLAEAHVGHILATRIHSLERNNHLQTASYNRRDNLRVRIVPLVAEAVFWHVTSGWPRGREGETRMLQAGEEREGHFGFNHSLISAPAVGGRLALDAGRGFLEPHGVIVTGLVSPETGEPQVDLEILTRAG
jgi:hypothetical protein